MHRTTLILEYDSPERARLVGQAIAQETGEIASDRTRASVRRSGPTVEVVLDADDLVALRAGQNTWLGLIGVAEHSTEIGDSVRGDVRKEKKKEEEEKEET
ncbi:MAG: KEOPS complex subunit Pcc1 [Halodesulfurarchaeum sp.]